MNTNARHTLFLGLGLVAGLLLANLLSGSGVLAQTAAQPERAKEPMITRGGEMPRYQVSAYGTSSGNGCYIIDTTTGETWHADQFNPAKKVSDKLAR